MNCPYCGSELDTGFRCLKCGYKWQNGIKQPEPPTAEKLLWLWDYKSTLRLEKHTHG